MNKEPVIRDRLFVLLKLAPQVRLELTTLRLTVKFSALSRHFRSFQNCTEIVDFL